MGDRLHVHIDRLVFDGMADGTALATAVERELTRLFSAGGAVPGPLRAGGAVVELRPPVQRAPTATDGGAIARSIHRAVAEPARGSRR